MTVLGPSSPGAALPGAILPPGCPAATNPPGQPYGIQFSAILNEPTALSVKTPGGLLLTIPSFSATACGLILLPSQTAVVQPNNVNLTVNGTTATLGQAILPVSVTPGGPTTGGVLPLPAPNGGLNLTIQVPAKNTTSQLGVTCDTIVNATLSTLPPGSPLVGPLSAATATLTVSIAIPATSTTVAPACPGFLASQIDGLIGMPLTQTSAIASTVLDICTIPVSVCPLPTGAARSASRVHRK
jgi:hypothetical protein